MIDALIIGGSVIVGSIIISLELRRHRPIALEPMMAVSSWTEDAMRDQPSSMTTVSTQGPELHPWSTPQAKNMTVVPQGPVEHSVNAETSESGNLTGAEALKALKGKSGEK